MRRHWHIWEGESTIRLAQLHAQLGVFRRDMDPSDAKKVALGDADPVTLLPMEDINSTFNPRVPLNTNVLNYSRQDNGKAKGKAAGKSTSEGILHFFGMRSVIIFICIGS